MTVPRSNPDRGRHPLTAATLCVFVLAATIVFPAAKPAAQNLNQYQNAPADVKAKMARVLTKARRDAKASKNEDLNRDTVNTDCSPVEIGNQPLPEKGRLSRDEQVVVVPGDIINICR